MDQDRPEGNEVIEREIRVNDQAVNLIEERLTAAEIKQVAIKQGVPIDDNFVLSIEHEPRKTRILAEDESIEVKPGACFVAVADDDNS